MHTTDSTSKRFYVYVLARPDGRPFYVGKGSTYRVHDHEREARNGIRSKKCNIIRKIWREGGQVQKYIVFETDDESEAFAYECELIALHGRDTLCNLTDGGDGASGVVLSAERRARQSIISKGRWARPGERERQRESLKSAMTRPGSKILDALQKGREFLLTPEGRAKANEAIRAALATPESVERRRQIMNDYYADPANLVAKSKKSKETWQDPDVQQKMSESIRESWNDPEIRAKRSDGIRAAMATPEYKQKRSEIQRRRSQDPEYIEARRQQMNTRYADPEERSKQSERSKAMWDDPEFRARMSEIRKASWARRKAARESSDS